eukprot:12405683-Karenia_brevis.AAC.1
MLKGSGYRTCKTEAHFLSAASNYGDWYRSWLHCKDRVGVLKGPSSDTGKTEGTHLEPHQTTNPSAWRLVRTVWY